MNKLEFEQVLKMLGIDNPLSITIGRFGEQEDVHYWNNLAIWYYGNYAVIHGKIPLEVINIIYMKYNNPVFTYGVRVENVANNETTKPSDYAVDDEYVKEIALDDSKEAKEEARIRLCKRNDDKKYLTGLQIDTKEGLLAFLLELKDYHLRQNKQAETEAKKYADFIEEINLELLKKSNFKISSNEMIQNNSEINIEKNEQDELLQKVKIAISDFDKAVNPFLSDESFEDISSYLKKRYIKTDTYIDHPKYRNGGCTLIISNSLEQSEDEFTQYERYQGKKRTKIFLFRLCHEFDKDNYMIAEHVLYVNTSSDIHDGEVIRINYLGNNNRYIELNITKNIIYDGNTTNYKPTKEEIEKLYNELLQVVEYAKKITGKKEKAKKRDLVC